MTCRKSYSCDLCHSSIGEPTEGIGIRWGAGNEIRNVFLTDSEHHLCNRCTAGLREMLGEIDKQTEIYRKLDSGEL